MFKYILTLGVHLFFVLIVSSCEKTINVTNVSDNSDNDIEYPCLTPNSDCKNNIKIGEGTFEFFSSFHIDSLSEVQGAIITFHGNNRNADDYFEKMASIIIGLGLTDDILIIAPKFATLYERSSDSDWYWNTTSWKWGMPSYNSPLGENISSFAIIDTILTKISDESLFPQLENVLITGHSSGAAFTHMFSYTKSENSFNGLNIKFAVVNNQYFVHPDDTRIQQDGSVSVLQSCNNYNDWPYGLNNLNPYMQIIGASLAKNNFFSNVVDYFVGENDTDTSLDSGCHYDILGSSRLEKNLNFNTYMDVISPNNSHQITIIPNLGHTTNTLSSDVFQTYIESIF